MIKNAGAKVKIGSAVFKKNLMKFITKRTKKQLTKMAGKAIPVFGAVVGAGFAIYRFSEGQLLSGVGELLSGVLGGLGMAPASFTIDGLLIAKDTYEFAIENGWIQVEKSI